MKDMLTVAKFTMKEMVRRKSFIISTLIILVFIFVGFNVPNLIKKMNGGSNETSKLLIIDNDDIFEGNLEILKQINSKYEIEIGKASFDEVKQKINNKEIEDAVIVEKDGNTIKSRYIVKNTTMMDGVPDTIIATINSVYTSMQISKLGLTPEQLQSISPNFEFSLEQTDEERANGNVLVMMIMSMILFFGIYFCVAQISSSITTEKTSKIMETLVTSTSPKNIIWGKTLGIGFIGLCQMVLFVGTAYGCANAFLDKELLSSVLDMSSITPALGIITAVYFILGYLEFALLYALTGSTVSKPEDIQSANMPVALLTVAGFYLSYFTMMNPTSKLNMIAGLLPISSPLCMPFRIMMGISGPKDVAISIAILVITCIIIAKVAVKIYSNAILNYGKKLSIIEALKMDKK